MRTLTLITKKIKVIAKEDGLCDVQANLKKFVTEIYAQQAGIEMANKYGPSLLAVLQDPSKYKQCVNGEITEAQLKKLSKEPKEGYNKTHGSKSKKTKAKN